MSGDSTIRVEDPRIVAAVERYRQMLLASPDGEVLCDAALDARLPDDVRNKMLRALLHEERKSRRKKGLPTGFETYFSRVWFDKCIDELVAVILEKDYLVEGRLGHGGQGRVYRARNRAVHNRKEALKIFLPTDPQYLKEFDNKQYLSMQARFDRESEALSKLDIEHLPRVHAVGNRDGLRYFTMEYIDGASLARRIEHDRTIDPRQSAQWMLTTAETLDELHDAKILHRDLKPSNLILNEKEKLYIVDFGLVKLMPGARDGSTGFDPKLIANLTLSHGYGSRGYVSPEQSQNASLVTSATDVYALGATLYHLLNGFPYLGDGADGPSHWLPHVPEALRKISSACLRVDPEKRPTARAVAEGLRAWLQRADRSTKTAPAVVEEKIPSRRRFLYFAAGGLAAVGVGGVVFFTREPRHGPLDIFRKAHDLRERLRKTLIDAGTPANREALPLARTAAALLSATELSPEVVSRCVADLQVPFSGTGVETKIQLDDLHRPVGWVSKSDPSHASFEAVAWMTIAQAKLVARLPREEGTDPQLVKTIQSQFERTQELYARYFDSRTGGWLPFANAPSEAANPLSTALALQMLVEVKRAGQALSPKAPGLRDDLILRALKYLATDGAKSWSLKSVASPEGDRALTLKVYATVWSAYADADVTPPTPLLTDWETAATEFVLTYRDRPPTEASTPLTQRAEAKTLSGDAKTIEETTPVTWYPLVVSLLQSLLTRGAKRFAEDKEMRTVRQFLGRLVVEKGDDTVARLEISGNAAAAVEMLLGLASVRAAE